VYRYSARQVAGAALAVSGLAALLLSDRQADNKSPRQSSALLGDALTIAGATGYAVTNVFTEQLLREAASAELLAGLGGFGFLWSILNAAVFEAGSLGRIQWHGNIVSYMAAYAAVLFVFYAGMPFLLQRSGSVVRSCLLLHLALCSALAASCRFLNTFSASTSTAMCHWTVCYAVPQPITAH
jgi:drug/metabolite transporter (DMT)-like permease